MNRAGVVNDKATVIIVDDHPGFRAGVTWFIERYSARCKVIAEAKNCVEAYKLYQELNPDILILDLNFLNGGPSGSSLISKLRDEGKTTKIVVLSGDEFLDSQAILELGADLCFDKGTNLEEV